MCANFTQNWFFHKVFTELDSDMFLREYDFVKITGRIINLCDEHCSFDFYCSNCKDQKIEKYNQRDDDDNITSCSQLNYDSNRNDWFCERCQSKDKNPILNIEIMIVLNCVGICRLVKVKLHKNTIRKFLPIDNFVKLHSEVDISGLIDKEISEPIACFISKITDAEIYAEELSIE